MKRQYYVSKEMIAKMNARRKRQQLIDECWECFWPFVACFLMLGVMYLYFGA